MLMHVMDQHAAARAGDGEAAVEVDECAATSRAAERENVGCNAVARVLHFTLQGTQTRPPLQLAVHLHRKVTEMTDVMDVRCVLTDAF